MPFLNMRMVKDYCIKAGGADYYLSVIALLVLDKGGDRFHFKDTSHSL